MNSGSDDPAERGGAWQGDSRIREIAHELRSPLGGIDSMIELLSRSQLDATQMRLVDGLRSASRHLRAVAQGVIEPTSATPPEPVTRRWPDLQALLAEIAVSAEARAQTLGVGFELSAGGSIPAEVEMAAHALRQMIENLLDNAFKHTRRGRVRLAVTVLDERSGYAGLRFAVEDTGPGIAPEELRRLFRPEARVSGDRTPGSGLGLSIVQRLARRQGGDAGAESVPGRGSTFWFTIRLKTPLAPPRETLRAAGRRVLVVDDNAASRTILVAILEHFGYAVGTAASGEEALAQLANGGFDAVTVDRTLPGIDGEETVRRLRAGGAAGRAVAVVAVTGHVLPEDRASFLNAGADVFVAKPVTARAVVDALEAAGCAPPARDPRFGDAA